MRLLNGCLGLMVLMLVMGIGGMVTLDRLEVGSLLYYLSGWLSIALIVSAGILFIWIWMQIDDMSRKAQVRRVLARGSR